MKSLMKNKKLSVCIVAVLVIIFIMGGVFLFNREKEKDETSLTNSITNSYVAYVKINPSIKLEYTQTCRQVDQNSNDLICEDPSVTHYELVNEDAKNIYKDVNLIGSSDDLFKVLNLICQTATENGIVFDQMDVYTDWDKIETYIQEKKEISDTIKYNIEITNKDDINKKTEEDEKLITYRVTFDTDGGNPIESQVVKKDEKVLKPSTPVKDGYNFIEWQLDNQFFDFDTIIIQDITLQAKWEKKANNPPTNPGTTNNNSSNPSSNNPPSKPNVPDNKVDSSNANTNSDSQTTNSSDNTPSSEENNNTQQPVTPPKEEDTHKGIINLNDNVMYITGDIVYECEHCISTSVIQKINSSKGITHRGLDDSYAWIRSINIPEGKYSSGYTGNNIGVIESWLINCGANMVGGDSDWEPKLLTEQVCNEYKLSCDRW